MSAEPRNAATERLVHHVAVLHRAAFPRSLYTDDFRLEDRRRVIGLPTANLDEFAEMRRVNLDLGAVRGSTERVLDVAGDRCCCIVHVTAYEHDRVSEMIQVLQFDETVERLHRLLLFDVDAIDDAVAEMECLHAESEPTATCPTPCPTALDQRSPGEVASRYSWQATSNEPDTGAASGA